MVMYVIALMTLLDKLRPEALGIKFTQAWYAYSIVVTRPEPFSKQQTDGTCMHYCCHPPRTLFEATN